MDQDVRIFQHALHAIRVGHKIGRQISAVELHAVHGLQLGDHGLRFLDRDHAILADFLHCVRNDVPDGVIAVGGNRANLRDHLTRYRLGELLHFLHGYLNGLLDAALQRHRIGPGRNRFHALAENRLCQNRRRGRAVTGDIGGLGSHFAHHLRAHVLERILQLDLFCNGHAVFGDIRAAKLLLQNHVPASGAQRNFHRVRQLVHAAKNGLPGIFCINDLFCHVR